MRTRAEEEIMTNEERRAIAARLRKTRVERYNSILSGIHLGEIVRVGAQIVSPHEDQVRAAADRLADLIEPAPSCEFWDSEERECYNVRTVRPVDRAALLALADEVDSMERVVYHNEVRVSDEALVSITRRIREACGNGGE